MLPSNAILVRIGVDHSYGAWNAPVDPETMEFVYVPIPEGIKTEFSENRARSFPEILPALNHFASRQGKDLFDDMKFPRELLTRFMHLDPDFDHLSYGDDGSARGSGIKHLVGGDLLVFYAGLKPIRPCDHRLIYAIVGLYVIKEVIPAQAVPEHERHKNAHTRKKSVHAADIVVYGQPAVSGRLGKCILIGEYRDRAYRVSRDVLDEWGGLSVNDGYIQRSACPPSFLDAERFYRWFLRQNAKLIARNNE